MSHQPAVALPRATKIVATLGPASSSAEMIERLIVAGVNVVRLNFSHGSAQDHLDRAAIVRAIAEKLGRDVGILVDLQVPLLRSISPVVLATSTVSGSIIPSWSTMWRLVTRCS